MCCVLWEQSVLCVRVMVPNPIMYVSKISVMFCAPIRIIYIAQIESDIVYPIYEEFLKPFNVFSVFVFSLTYIVC